MTLFEAVKDLMEFVNEDPEVAKALQSLKRDIAKDYVTQLKEKKPDFFLMVAEDKVVDYLLDEGILDQFHDAAVGKMLETMSWSAGELKEFRERLNSASTQEELANLKIRFDQNLQVLKIKKACKVEKYETIILKIEKIKI